MTYADPHPPEHVLAELAESIGPDGLPEVSAQTPVRTLDDSSSALPSDSAGLLAHVRRCESCRAVVEGVARVRTTLQAVPAQVPIPPSVSARITAALAAEAASMSGEATEPGLATVTSIQDHPVAWFRRRLPQTLTAAAAAAVIGFTGYAMLDGSPGDIVSGGAEDSAADEQADRGELTAAEDQSTFEQPEGADTADGHAADESEENEVTDSDDAGDDWTMMSDGDLSLALADVWRHGGEVEAQCGATLADELGTELVGSTYVGADTLVVMSDDGNLIGWIVADCESGADSATEAATMAEPTE